MTSEQIKMFCPYSNPDVWKRVRKYKDSDKNVVREFKDLSKPDVTWIFTTNPTDTMVVSQSFTGLSREKAAADLITEQARFDDLCVQAKAENIHVFCCIKYEEGQTLFCVTPKCFWDAEHCLDDQSLSADAVRPFGLIDQTESVYELLDEKGDPKKVKKELLAAGFIEDPAFKKSMRNYGG
ncbi:MAG: hypothetical protein WC824_14815 [Bacteroidota bacterium]|jgi:hypothetical protein